MADPVTVTCNVSPCVIVHQISVPPFDLSVGDAALISGAITLVWSAGWAIRQIIRTVNSDSVSNESES